MIPRSQNNKSGFTLVELAVILTILSMLITVIITVVPFVEDEEAKDTTTSHLGKVEKAILAYYNQKGYLPCPSMLDGTIAGGNFGTSTDCSSAGSSSPSWVDVNSNEDRIRIGAVPTRELNISDEFAFDGWNNRITYVTIANLAQSDKLFNLHKTTTTNIITINDSAGNKINPDNPSQIAFVLISHGNDGAGARNYPGSSTLTCNADNSEENCNNDAVFRDQFINTDNATSYYDDYVVWKTKEQLKTEGDYAGTGGGTTAKYALFALESSSNLAMASGTSTVQFNTEVINNTDVTYTASNVNFPAGRYVAREGHIGCGIGKMVFYRETAASTNDWPGIASIAATNDNNSCEWSVGSFDYTLGSAYNTSATIYAESAQATYGGGRAVGGIGSDNHYYGFMEVWQE